MGQIGGSVRKMFGQSLFSRTRDNPSSGPSSFTPRNATSSEGGNVATSADALSAGCASEPIPTNLISTSPGPLPLKPSTAYIPTPENELGNIMSLRAYCDFSLARVASEIAPVPSIGLLMESLTRVFRAIERTRVNKAQWRLLRGRCGMVMHIAGVEVANNGLGHYPGLQEATDKLGQTLKKIEERAQHYNKSSDMVAFLLHHTISNEVQALFADLDSCLRPFSYTTIALQAQWIGEFRAVQERESSDIQYLKHELEKMNMHTDITGQNAEQVFAEEKKLAEALEDILINRFSIIQAPATAPFSTYIEAQRVIRTILSVTQIRLPPGLILGQQCTIDYSIPIKTGTTCDVYQASFLGGEKVAKKVLRIGISDREYVEQCATRFLQVTSSWSGFRSDFILPFYGMGMESFGSGEYYQLYTISPLMNNFDSITYMRQYRSASWNQRNILRIITDAAKGLQYLHSLQPPVVHSEMKGDNILVTDSGGGVLGGFGLGRLMKVKSGPTTTPMITGKDDSRRWLAPELFVDDPPLETASDVWGWAMATLEIISGFPPYHKYKSSPTILLQITKGPPSRKDYPTFESYAYRPDEMWQLLERCWAMNSCNRPTMDQVVIMLNAIARVD